MKSLNLVSTLSILLAPCLAMECTVSSFQSFLSSSNINASVADAISLGDNSTFEVEYNAAYPESPTGLSALCAVQVNVTSDAGSFYSFGLFLPEAWNHRFLAVGNGGYAGGINWIDMGAGVGYGFAVMSTDTGHNGSFEDATWAYHNPEAVVDWGWRAMHGSTVIAKQLVNEWYGSSLEYSYFSGCSVGGRQGLRALGLFPDDYDGVSAGAPAWWTTHLQLWAVKTLTYNAPANSSHTIPESMFDVINKEVIRQCDSQDGLVDTVISDPIGCNFNPLTLLCSGNDTADCLDLDQMHTLTQIYSDWVDVNQTFVFPHFLLGTESSWDLNVAAGEESKLATQSEYAQYMLGLGSDWSWHDLDLSTVLLSEQMNPGNATADDYDISPFYHRGGKLIHHHGLADATLATGSSIYWYDQVSGTLAPKDIDVDDFYRMFLIPGMDHCQNSPSSMNAPWYIAGANQAAVLGSSISGVPDFHDSRHDVILALMAWVENGTAPGEIIATIWNNNTVEDGVYRQRPICPYPAMARYRGSGDPNAAENWECESYS